MTDSPKRKSEILADGQTEVSKNIRIDEDDDDKAAEISINAPDAAPDALIDHKAAIAYWSSTEPTVSGVLGGFPQVSRIDIQGSSNFLAKLRRHSEHFPSSKKLGRAVDCGGRHWQDSNWPSGKGCGGCGYCGACEELNRPYQDGECR